MARPSHRSRPLLAAAAGVLAGVALAAAASASEEDRVCKQKTKTMGCTLESLSGAVRATAVAAGGELPGKCQIDSPAVAAETRTYEQKKLLCDDPSIADTGDQMIALCKDASNAVRANCRTICQKLVKIDAEGDPVDGSPCRMVVDRTVVTTRTDRFPGGTGCRALCEASIVCVCDP